MSELPDAGDQRIRLDKWLWRARFFKSRSLATAACGAGKVRIDGTPAAKAHTAVRPGQVLTFVKERHVRVIKILAIPGRRGPAGEARICYEDLAPPEAGNRLPGQPGRDGPARNRLGRVGRRPTKKDRRRLEHVSGDGPAQDDGQARWTDET